MTSYLADTDVIIDHLGGRADVDRLVSVEPASIFVSIISVAELWGRGIQRIVEACRNAGAPAPEVNYDPGDLWFEFPFSQAYLDIIPPVGERQGKASVETAVETAAIGDTTLTGHGPFGIIEPRR